MLSALLLSVLLLSVLLLSVLLLSVLLLSVLLLSGPLSVLSLIVFLGLKFAFDCSHQFTKFTVCSSQGFDFVTEHTGRRLGRVAGYLG